MPDQPEILKGTIHGATIELENAPNLPDGQQVTVTVQPVSQPRVDDSLEALKRAAGSWSDDVAGLDQFLEWNRRQRKVPRREIPE